MKVAFYAPMKSPQHPRPSGDRRLGRLLVEALRRAGHEVEIASHLRAWEGRGEVSRQQAIQQQGLAEVEMLLARYRDLPAEERPVAWFTYHLYHKAPDWIGPRVAAALNIPYLVAEASHAPKQRAGPWALGYQAAQAALQSAAAIIVLNPADLKALQALAGVRDRLCLLPPFLDTDSLPPRGHGRRQLAARYGLDEKSRWLLAVGMMRDDAKLRSYALLARAATALRYENWQLVLVGDGPAEARVRQLFKALDPARIRWPGLLPNVEVHELMAAADLFVWPAINEAFGMAILEAQACGLTVVAGQSGGVSAIVANGVTGQLVPSGDTEAFAQAVDDLLDDQPRRRAMSAAARGKACREHGLEAASERLDALLRRVAVQAPV